MTHVADESVRIGILWRGDRSVPSPAPPADRQLGPLFEAFARLPVILVPIPFAENAVEEVREALLTCDGVLVWVNPIQDGVNRAKLDALLSDLVTLGIFVSASPEVILKLGTKEVLFHTRELGWGSDTALYRSPADFRARFPTRLADHGTLVLKQGRGNGGNGVWKLDVDDSSPVDGGLHTNVRVLHARSRDGSPETMSLDSFMGSCEEYFVWSGCLVDQTYQERLVEGMLRCYFTHDEVVGFARQWPKGLLTPSPGEVPAPPRSSIMEGPEISDYQALRVKVENDWVPQMKTILGLDRERLPVIWDADFFFGPKDAEDEDTYVLCEINVSAVWPFPAMAADKVAAAAVARAQASRSSRT